MHSLKNIIKSVYILWGTILCIRIHFSGCQPGLYWCMQVICTVHKRNTFKCKSVAVNFTILSVFATGSYVVNLSQIFIFAKVLK